MKYSKKDTILVVDDEPTVADMIVEDLSEMGYICIKAATGEDALEKLSKGNIMVMLLDLNLPGISGMDVLKEVKSVCPETAVIVITGADEIQTVVKSMKNGAMDYLTKPFKIEELNESILQVLGRFDHGNNRQVEYANCIEPEECEPHWMARLNCIARGSRTRLELELGQEKKVIENTAVIGAEMGIHEDFISMWVEEQKKKIALEMEFAASLLERLKDNPSAGVLLSIADLSEGELNTFHQN